MRKFTFTFLLIALGFSFQTPKAQTISTIAGNGTQGYTGDGGPATNAELNLPYDVKSDAANNIYITCYTGSVVRMVNPSGTISTFAGNGTAGFSGDGGPATAADLNHPAGLYFDAAASNLYIADGSNGRIRMVNSSGIITTFAGMGSGFSGDGGPATAAKFNLPFQPYKDAGGNMYVADYSNDRVRIIDPAGIINTFAGIGVAGYSGDGGPATSAEINSPSGIIADAAGNVYIADYSNHRIRIVNSSGVINTFAGNGVPGYSGDGGPATAAEIYGPVRLCMDTYGAIYFVEWSGERVRRIGTNGIISTLAGNGVQGFSGDGGPATAAEFYSPAGLGFDNSGNLYITDAHNNRVREIAGIPLAVNSVANNTEIIAYPNPATDKLTVQLTGVSGKAIINLYSLNGQQILNVVKENETMFTLSTAGLAKGTYLLKVQAGNCTMVKKIEIAR